MAWPAGSGSFRCLIYRLSCSPWGRRAGGGCGRATGGCRGLQRVLAQTPQLLSPGGVCVVVLSGRPGHRQGPSVTTDGSGTRDVGGADDVRSSCSLGEMSDLLRHNDTDHQHHSPQQVVDVPDDEEGHGQVAKQRHQWWRCAGGCRRRDWSL